MCYLCCSVCRFHPPQILLCSKPVVESKHSCVSYSYLHPVSVYLMEENAEGVRLGGYISVQQVGCSNGHLHPSDAVLGSNTSLLALSGRAQSVGHGLRSQRIKLKERKHREIRQNIQDVQNTKKSGGELLVEKTHYRQIKS